MLLNYTSWQAFKIEGKRFLALEQKDGGVKIIDDEMHEYGSWLKRGSFEKCYRRHEGDLRLT